MKFEDLLDEDGQGTRRCDAWLAENIEGREVVADDWPCGTEPECGRYEACDIFEDDEPMGSWYDKKDYVVVKEWDDPRWPPESKVEEYDHGKVKFTHVDVEPVPRYTTGDSIDPIWGLAKEYLNQPELVMISEESYFTKAFPISSHTQNTEQLAIAEALFKAYQKGN